MTEFASAPVTLSPSESMLSGKPSFFRRASVTRGTISSMAKDVRSADTIPTIKRQKSQQFAPQALSLLTRRKSMMNMSTRIPNSLYNININPKSFQQQQQRARTMSTADLLISSNQCMQQKLGDIKTLKRQQQQRDAPITKPVNAISATFRLDQDTQKSEVATTLPPSTAPPPPVYQKVKEEINNNNNSNYYNLRKCEACNPEGIPLHHPHHHHVQDKQTNNNNNNNNNHWNTEEDTNDWSTSTAPDCYSSSSQSQSSFQKKNRKDRRSNEWLTSSAANNNAGLLFPMTQHMEQQYETLLENLNSSFTAYSNQMQDLSNTFVDGCSSSFSSLSSLSDYNDDDDYESEYTSKTHKYKSQIQECKSLIHQQQDLLNKLEALIEEKEAATLNQKQKQLSPPNNNNNNMNNKNTPTSATTTSPTSPSSDSSKKKASSGTSDWKAAFSDLFQAKSSGVSEVVVRRNKENEPDKTVIVVSGTGTTTELSLLPKHVNKTKNSVQYVEYKLSLTLNDRKNRFILLPEIKWQVDKKVDQCEFTRKEQAGGARCSVQFGWTWRKHHCRRCGHIYCSTHSANRLPLFQQNASDQPIFSRVCDGCFFDLSTPFLLTS